MNIIMLATMAILLHFYCPSVCLKSLFVVIPIFCETDVLHLPVPHPFLQSALARCPFSYKFSFKRDSFYTCYIVDGMLPAKYRLVGYSAHNNVNVFIVKDVQLTSNDIPSLKTSSTHSTFTTIVGQVTAISFDIDARGRDSSSTCLSLPFSSRPIHVRTWISISPTSWKIGRSCPRLCSNVFIVVKSPTNRVINSYVAIYHVLCWNRCNLLYIEWGLLLRVSYTPNEIYCYMLLPDKDIPVSVP